MKVGKTATVANSIIEPVMTRDHTEKMLKGFGAKSDRKTIVESKDPEARPRITIRDERDEQERSADRDRDAVGAQTRRRREATRRVDPGRDAVPDGGR